MIDPNLECWEATTDSAVLFEVYDQHGRPKAIKVGGSTGVRKVWISEDDRRTAEDAGSGVFRSGLLRRTDGEHANDESQPGKSVDQLLRLLDLGANLETALETEPVLSIARLRTLSQNPRYSARFTGVTLDILARVWEARSTRKLMPQDQIEALAGWNRS